MNLNDIRKLGPLYRALNDLRRVGSRLFMRACHALVGVKPRRVFFSSFKGRDFSDSPARICEQLHALRPDIEIVWQLRRPGDAPDYVRAVPPRSLSALLAISTARCLVDNFNRPQYMLKFPGQLYVQTWHGDRGFKKMLFDMEDGQFFPDGEQMDLGVAGSGCHGGRFLRLRRFCLWDVRLRGGDGLPAVLNRALARGGPGLFGGVPVLLRPRIVGRGAPWPPPQARGLFPLAVLPCPGRLPGRSAAAGLFRLHQHVDQRAFVCARRNPNAHILCQAAQLDDGLLVQGLIIHRLPPMG